MWNDWFLFTKCKEIVIVSKKVRKLKNLSNEKKNHLFHSFFYLFSTTKYKIMYDGSA